MHGVLIRDKKILSSEEKLADLAAGDSAMSKLRDVIDRKKRRNYSPESLSLSMELLRLNPELILAWNFRREILLDRNDAELLVAELSVLKRVMIEMTKSYCLWTHRRWILTMLGDVMETVLEGEKNLVEKIIELDCRNFHAWSYRNWLDSNYRVFSKEINFNYSTILINSDFSNYAAWFLRQQNFIAENSNDEIDFVYSAIFTEPNDQSAWQYRDWLVENRPELQEKDKEYREELRQVVEEKDMKYLLLAELREGPTDNEEIVSKLCSIDPMRKGYYSSLL